MKQHLLVVMALATLFCFSREAYAQYPGMRHEAWYKENVLKLLKEYSFINNKKFKNAR